MLLNIYIKLNKNFVRLLAKIVKKIYIFLKSSKQLHVSVSANSHHQTALKKKAESQTVVKVLTFYFLLHAA